MHVSSLAHHTPTARAKDATGPLRKISEVGKTIGVSTNIFKNGASVKFITTLLSALRRQWIKHDLKQMVEPSLGSTVRVVRANFNWSTFAILAMICVY